MKRGSRDRLEDIRTAITAIDAYAADGAVLHDPMALDAVRTRLVEIGEAAAAQLNSSG